MIQHGQVFKLTMKGTDGQPLWAYRYRFEGRGSARPQVGGFVVGGSTTATSAAATGGPLRRLPGSSRYGDLYDLRHTHVTFALRAGVAVFAVHRLEYRDDRPALRPPRQ